MTEQNYAPVRDSTTLIDGAVKKPPERRPYKDKRKSRVILPPSNQSTLRKILAEFTAHPHRRGLIKELCAKYKVPYRHAQIYVSQYAPRTVASEPSEVWKPVVGYEGFFQVSSLGRIKRTPSQVNVFGTREKLLQGRLHSGGRYYAHCLRVGDSVVTHLTHRLVAKAFIPNPDNKPEVNHKDGNRLNNQVSNLEWVTPTENMVHARTHGLIPSQKGQTYRKRNPKTTASNGNQ